MIEEVTIYFKRRDHKHKKRNTLVVRRESGKAYPIVLQSAYNFVLVVHSENYKVYYPVKSIKSITVELKED